LSGARDVTGRVIVAVAGTRRMTWVAQRYLAAKVENTATARHEVSSVVSQLAGRPQQPFDRVRCLGGDGALWWFVSSACDLSVGDDLT